MWLMRRPKLALALALVGLLLLFAAQNTEAAALHFLFWAGTMPVWALILVDGAVGALVGWVLCEWRHRQHASRRSAAEHGGAGAADGGGAQA